ncbi:MULTISPECIES: LysR family transcriptional regulator [unclassified Streptomyces]|uniref:LysR family transcriptional regulator n=1 Tax=unclassified Streptomyces TaxID=2593676 RepID=UPI002E33EA41|nr:LysR family transcriptional regulator [Streptomyces sp. NBC_01361]
MYDLHRLRLLLELKRRGTLGAVADALNYSRSTISQQLAQLEAEAGVPLLQPVGRRVRLTPQADILVGHTEVLLREMEAAETAVAQSLTELTGTVRVGVFQTGMLRLLPQALTMVQRRHPRLRIEIFQDEPQLTLPRLATHDLDLVLVEEFPGHKLPRQAGIEYQPLWQDRLRLAVPEQLAAEGVPCLSRLAGHAWVAEPEGTASRDWLQSLCREEGFEPDIRYTSADLLMHRQLVAHGHAVAVLPDLLLPSAEISVVLSDLAEVPCFRSVLTATRTETVNHPAIRTFREALETVSSE